MVPCRIFRNLRRAQQAVLSPMENLVRTDPSAQDTAKELVRAKRLIEEEVGRKVTVEDLMTLFEGAGQPGGKVFHRRHVYRLLRIAEMDEKVLEAARKYSLAMDYLVSIARVRGVEVQLALIESTQKERLTRQEVRLVVNRLIDIDAGQTDLAELIAEVRRAGRGPLGNAVSDTAKDSGDDAELSAMRSSVYATKPSVDLGTGAKVDPLGDQAGEAQTCGSTEVKGLRPLGEKQALEAGKSPGLDLDVAYGEHGKWKPPPAQGMERWPGVAVREDWLREVEARFGQEEEPGSGRPWGKCRIRHKTYA